MAEDRKWLLFQMYHEKLTGFLPVKAALHAWKVNIDTRRQVQDSQHRKRNLLWQPPLRLIFQDGIVFDTHGALTAKNRKSWERKLGPFLKVELVKPNDPFGGLHVAYIYTGGKRHETFMRKERIRKSLGKVLASLVNTARRMSKRNWLEQIHTPDDHVTEALRGRKMIKVRSWNHSQRTRKFLHQLTVLGYQNPEHFWRVVRGTKTIPRMVQALLF